VRAFGPGRGQVGEGLLGQLGQQLLLGREAVVERGQRVVAAAKPSRPITRNAAATSCFRRSSAATRVMRIP
jgi:hypothetical protein